VKSHGTTINFCFSAIAYDNYDLYSKLFRIYQFAKKKPFGTKTVPIWFNNLQFIIFAVLF